MNPPDEDYSDLIGERPDSDALRLVRDLDRVYDGALPPHRDIAIQRALAESAREVRSRPQHRVVTLLRRPLVRVVAVLLIPMVFGGGIYAAYAAISLVDQALSSTLASRQIVEHHLGETINLSQSRCGFTARLGSVYADPHRTVIGYTLRGPAGRTFFGGIAGSDIAPMLEDAHRGQLLPAEGVFAFGSHGNQTGDFLAFETDLGLPPGAKPWVRWLAVPRDNLSLRLTMPAIQMTERYDRPAPTGRSCEQYSRVGRANGHWWRDVTISGPFSFAFTVPVLNNLRVVTLHQTVQAAGVTVTLERVEITPSDTRVYWRERPVSPNFALAPEIGGPPLPKDAPPLTKLLTTQRDGTTFWRGFFLGGDNGLRVSTFGVPGYDYRGPWTVAFQPAPTQAASRTQPSGSPITFHFTVP